MASNAGSPAAPAANTMGAAATDTESLSALAAEASVHLEKVWDEVGLTSAERSTRLHQLQADVAAVYNARVRAEEEEREGIRNEITSVGDRIEDMCAALCCPQPHPPSMAHPGTLREALAALRANHDAIEKDYQAYMSRLGALHERLDALCADLDQKVPDGFEGIGEKLTDARVEAFEAQVAQAEALAAERTREISQLVVDINALWDELSLEAEPGNALQEGVASSGEGLKPRTSTIEQLQALARELTEEKGRREEKLKGIGAQIAALWSRLKVDEDARAAWLDEHQGLGDVVIAACEEKLAQLQAEMKARIVELISDARARITALWDEMHYAGAERVFAGMSTPADAFDDGALAAHEAHIAELEARLAVMRPIIRAISKRAAIQGEREEYEAMMADPSRLLSRGRNLEARVREEKMERRIKKELPAVTARLKTMLTTWRDAEDQGAGKPFVWDGVDYLLTIAQEEEDYARAKKDAKAKKDADRKRAVADSDGTVAGAPFASPRKAATGASKFRAAAHIVSVTATARSPGAALKRPAAGAPRVYKTLPLPKRNRTGVAGTGAKTAEDADSGSSAPLSSASSVANVAAAASRARATAAGKSKLRAPGSKIPAPGAAASTKEAAAPPEPPARRVMPRRRGKAGIGGAVAAMMAAGAGDCDDEN